MTAPASDHPQHTFAGNPLDRAEALRRDPDALAQLLAHGDSRFLIFDGLRPLVRRSDNASELGWVEAQRLTNEICQRSILLGTDAGTGYFAVDIVSGTGAEAKASAEPLRSALTEDAAADFIDARSAAMALPQSATGILAQARSQLDWHRKHQFCNLCGQPTIMERGGQARRCSGCNASLFPRTDPVAIMLITHGDRCLLGQSHGPLVSTGMYSALAGFIDQGESIEAAVRREVAEEAGLQVGPVQYHSSQPWPFPYSLMIGCLGEALSTEIAMDETEMADVRWFERDEVSAALIRATNGEAPSRAHLSLPGPLAIAHHLVKAWIDDEPSARFR
ncbi:MAG: NAD(+) diphosphatase [Pseudomonadales bacterium]